MVQIKLFADLYLAKFLDSNTILCSIVLCNENEVKNLWRINRLLDWNNHHILSI